MQQKNSRRFLEINNWLSIYFTCNKMNKYKRKIEYKRKKLKSKTLMFAIVITLIRRHLCHFFSVSMRTMCPGYCMFC